nr:HAMP domain-containing protein [Massilia glaciei]
MTLLHRVPLLWKVLFARGIAMLCMALYFGATALVFKQNNERLADVRDVQFPVLETSTENVGALDKIIDILNSAAAAGEAEQLQGADAIAARVRANYARLGKIDAGERAALLRLAAGFDTYYGHARAVAEMMAKNSGSPDAARLAAMGASLNSYRGALGTFREAANRRFVGTVNAATGDAVSAMRSGAAIGVFGLLVTLAFALVLARALSNQLQRAVGVAQTVAAGDLSSRIDSKAGDETGQLLRALRDMNASLVGIVGKVRAGTDNIAAGSVEIARGNGDLSRRTEHQAGALERTAGAML